MESNGVSVVYIRVIRDIYDGVKVSVRMVGGGRVFFSLYEVILRINIKRFFFCCSDE